MSRAPHNLDPALETHMSLQMSGRVTYPTKVTLEPTSCLVVDGQGRMVALGKPILFGDMADTFCRMCTSK